MHIVFVSLIFIFFHFLITWHESLGGSQSPPFLLLGVLNPLHSFSFFSPTYIYIIHYVLTMLGSAECQFFRILVLVVTNIYVGCQPTGWLTQPSSFICAWNQQLETGTVISLICIQIFHSSFSN